MLKKPGREAAGGGGPCRKKLAASAAEGGGHVEKSWPRQRPRGGAMSKKVHGKNSEF